MKTNMAAVSHLAFDYETNFGNNKMSSGTLQYPESICRIDFYNRGFSVSTITMFFKMAASGHLGFKKIDLILKFLIVQTFFVKINIIDKRMRKRQ